MSRPTLHDLWFENLAQIFFADIIRTPRLKKEGNKVHCTNSPVPFLCFIRKVRPPAKGLTRQTAQKLQKGTKTNRNKRKRLKIDSKNTDKCPKRNVLSAIKPDQLALNRNPLIWVVRSPPDVCLN